MLYDETGKVVEGAMTQEEVNTKITEKDTAIADLQKKIDDGVSKGTSVVELRKQLDAKNKEFDDFKTKVITDLSNNHQQQQDRDLRDTVLRISEGDVDLAKKIEDDYKLMVKDGDTDELKREKLGKAYKLNAGTVSPDIMSRVIGSAGAPPSNAGDPTVGGFPEALVQMGARLGLSRDDFKNRKYQKPNN